MSTGSSGSSIGVIGAFVEGWRRVLRAPALWAGILVVVLPAASAAVWPGDRVRPFQEAGDLSHDENVPPSAAFQLLGIGALPVVVQVQTEYAGLPLEPTAAGMAVGVYLFLWGGCLDRLARARPVGAGPFFAACGVNFWRFLRLCVPVGLAYWAIWWGFPSVHPAVSIAGLVAVNVVAGYAVVRIVVEDRRSALGALVASIRFIRRRAFSVLALYGLSIGAVLVILVLWNGLMARILLVVPWSWVRAVMPLGWLLHLLGRLALAASAVAFFQGSLAHAGYTAAPLPVWPDSPAAEAIENLAGHRGEVRGQKPEARGQEADRKETSP
ncbi:MAG TPA: hypothetical protein VLT86_14845 [Vicinamibacterales bacterium]|nr:hypothetical protein [Vicinamibacterales bacterium]